MTIPGALAITRISIEDSLNKNIRNRIDRKIYNLLLWEMLGFALNETNSHPLYLESLELAILISTIYNSLVLKSQRESTRIN